MTGSLAPPPPYGSEHGSILLETSQREYFDGPPPPVQPSRARTSAVPTSPGPARSPTDISLNNFDVGGPSSTTVVVGPPMSARETSPPPDYASQTSKRSSSDGSDGNNREGERRLLLLNPQLSTSDAAPAYRERSRGRSGSAPARAAAGPSGRG
jgi:hypothetical protein